MPARTVCILTTALMAASPAMAGMVEGDAGACAASLVAPAVALTAAHCLRSGEVLAAPSDLRFRARDGGEIGVVSYIVAPGYDPARPKHTIARDWALLRLERPPGEAYLAVAGGSPPVGSLVGRGQGEACAVRGDLATPLGRLFTHACPGKPGDSGTALLAGAAIIGIHVAFLGRGAEASGVAVPASAFAAAVAAAQAPDSGSQ